GEDRFANQRLFWMHGVCAWDRQSEIRNPNPRNPNQIRMTKSELSPRIDTNFHEDIHQSLNSQSVLSGFVIRIWFGFSGIRVSEFRKMLPNIKQASWKPHSQIHPST